MNIIQEIELHWKQYGDFHKFKDLEVDSYDMMRGKLTKYAFGKLRNWMDAEDAVQEAYVHALTYPPRGEGHNFAGLYKLYLDRAIVDVKNRNYNRNNVLQEDMYIEEEGLGTIDLAESTDMSPDQIVDIIHQTDLIMDMSDSLKPKQKAIVRLALIFGYSYKEIEEITKSTTKTVDNTLTYFRQKVREHPRYEDLRI